MFGYVTPMKPELKMREYELYKSVYCGLCKETGRNFGPLSTMFLNYDFVFLAMLLTVSDHHSVKISPGHCMLHPLKKTNICVKNPELTISSYLSILLLYHKADDNVRDSKGLKRILSAFLRLLIRPAYKKVRQAYPKQAASVKDSVDQLFEIEKRKEDSLDKPADTFATLFFSLMDLSVEDQKGRRIAGELARHLGRWIYIMDSFDDMEKDIKENNFNPLFYRFSLESNEKISDFKKRIALEVDFTLTQSLAAASSAFELLEPHPFTAILQNIIYIGMADRQQKIIHGEDVPENGSI